MREMMNPEPRLWCASTCSDLTLMMSLLHRPEPPRKKTTTSKWDVISVFKANVPLTSDSFFPPPNRDHDYRHLPHPVEMGPQESWNSHPDCGEASGAPGHAGISADMQSLLIKPVQMVAQGLLWSCAFLFYFFYSPLSAAEVLWQGSLWKALTFT